MSECERESEIALMLTANTLSAASFHIKIAI